jgi:uncharacterized membrane protein SpoIIM required for sporulation
LGPTLKAFLALLALFLAAAGLGYAYAAGDPSAARSQFESVSRGLQKNPSFTTIFLHNISRDLAFITPYVLAKLAFRGGRNLLTRLLALLPLVLVLVNGFIVGMVVVVGSHYIVPKAFGCPPDSSSSMLVTLSLLLPHGVFEVAGMLLLAAIPLAVESGEKPRRALILSLFAIMLTAVAAFIEVYITLLVAVLTASSLCPH